MMRMKLQKMFLMPSLSVIMGKCFSEGDYGHCYQGKCLSEGD